MANHPPTTYTSHAGISHIRRSGERTALCGRYFPAAHLTRETTAATLPLCSGCAVLSMHDAPSRTAPMRTTSWPTCQACGSQAFTVKDDGPLTCLYCSTKHHDNNLRT